MAIILRCKLLTWPTRGIWTRASRHGRPTRELVGPDAQAAWLVAQHAISLPDDERKCSEILAHAFAVGQVPAWQMAMLLDRIRTFEEQPQAYGTQFDWDDEGKLSPVFIENRDGVDQRRLDVGLKMPRSGHETYPGERRGAVRLANLAEYGRRMDEGTRRAGWR